ncbi:Hypothetical predicted protein [Octopus vulgaris]|uniref:Secreted protein n=1 Tax=Octopus vulgaris TaxID=6645 RepID=A0AA36AKK0_OCTVU|nr:Hypothetical predicted protein [Octopus vulgaris]
MLLMTLLLMLDGIRAVIVIVVAVVGGGSSVAIGVIDGVGHGRNGCRYWCRFLVLTESDIDQNFPVADEKETIVIHIVAADKIST